MGRPMLKQCRDIVPTLIVPFWRDLILCCKATIDKTMSGCRFLTLFATQSGLRLLACCILLQCSVLICLLVVG